jgi:N utilization substance protein B
LTTRRKSRELALQILYQLDISKQEAPRAISQLHEHFSPEEEKDAFLERIVLGVLEHSREIDSFIEKYSENWRLDRMSVIDRAILRMAVFEFLYCQDIPPKVTLNEAIDLGKRYGSEGSGSFVNGILDQILNKAIRKPASLRILENES